jgi:hypothetical protein
MRGYAAAVLRASCVGRPTSRCRPLGPPPGRLPRCAQVRVKKIDDGTDANELAAKVGPACGALDAAALPAQPLTRLSPVAQIMRTFPRRLDKASISISQLERLAARAIEHSLGKQQQVKQERTRAEQPWPTGEHAPPAAEPSGDQQQDPEGSPVHEQQLQTLASPAIAAALHLPAPVPARPHQLAPIRLAGNLPPLAQPRLAALGKPAHSSPAVVDIRTHHSDDGPDDPPSSSGQLSRSSSGGGSSSSTSSTSSSSTSSGGMSGRASAAGSGGEWDVLGSRVHLGPPVQEAGAPEPPSGAAATGPAAVADAPNAIGSPSPSASHEAGNAGHSPQHEQLRRSDSDASVSSSSSGGASSSEALSRASSAASRQALQAGTTSLLAAGVALEREGSAASVPTITAPSEVLPAGPPAAPPAAPAEEDSVEVPEELDDIAGLELELELELAGADEQLQQELRRADLGAAGEEEGEAGARLHAFDDLDAQLLDLSAELAGFSSAAAAGPAAVGSQEAAAGQAVTQQRQRLEEEDEEDALELELELEVAVDGSTDLNKASEFELSLAKVRACSSRHCTAWV